MTKTLGGLIGMGWDDMVNDYTLPVFKVTYKECLVDPDNTYLVPDNVLLIPIKKTALDKQCRTQEFFSRGALAFRRGARL